MKGKPAGSHGKRKEVKPNNTKGNMKELVDARETMLARHRLELAMMNQAINAAAALQLIEPEDQHRVNAMPRAQTPNRPTGMPPATPARKCSPVKTQAVQTAGRATPQPKAGSVPALILKALQQTRPPGTTSAAIYTWLVAKHPDMKTKLDKGLHVGLKQLFKQGWATRTAGPDGEFLYLLQPANAPAQKKVTIPGLVI